MPFLNGKLDPNMQDSDKGWKFLDAVREQQEKLYSELTATWDDVSALSSQLKALREGMASHSFLSGSAAYNSATVEEAGKALLQEPLNRVLSRLPMRRALGAILGYRTAIQSAVQQQLHVLPYSAKEFFERFGMARKNVWLGFLPGRGRLGSRLLLQNILTSFFAREALARAHLDSHFQLLLARAALQLCESWRTWRQLILRQSDKVDSPKAAMSVDQDALQRRTEGLQKKAATLIERYRRWSVSGEERLTATIIGGSWFSESRHRVGRLQARCEQYISFWQRQSRAIESLLGLELRLWQLEIGALKITNNTIDSVRLEQRTLSDTISAMLEWLEVWIPGESSNDPPIGETRLLGLEERIKKWTMQFSAAVSRGLPEEVRYLNPRKKLPIFKSSWRLMKPRTILIAAIEHHGGQEFSKVLCRVVDENLKIAREIELARDVIDYALESWDAEGRKNPGLLTEAVDNARELLKTQVTPVVELDDEFVRSSLNVVSTIFSEGYKIVEVNQVGLFALLGRQKGRKALADFNKELLSRFQGRLKKIKEKISIFLNRILEKSGLRLGTRPFQESVMRQPSLAQVLEVELLKRDLPRVYRRLFSLAPVEDARFLIGRDEEMNGLEEALEHWESDHFASVLIIGALGSGKTSILNCANSSIFAGRDLLRGNFGQRLTTAEQMHSYLCDLFSISTESDVVQTLGAGRRVVILEEFERSFLRKVGGFEALYYFLRFMQPMAGTTLWILALNDEAFRYMDAATGLGRYFSHRINAMSVRKEDLINAIMQRHNLSGFKLSFAAPPSEDSQHNVFRRFTKKRDPRKAFFDALYQQSGGVFRSAFELWQGSIEQVEDGVVELRQPLIPDYTSLRNELQQIDYFALVAILQHASLTDDELAQVLGKDVKTSRLLIQHLSGLELLEPDPRFPGMRVRAEARRFVFDSLHRVNLL